MSTHIKLQTNPVHATVEQPKYQWEKKDSVDKGHKEDKEGDRNEVEQEQDLPTCYFNLEYLFNMSIKKSLIYIKMLLVVHKSKNIA